MSDELSAGDRQLAEMLSRATADPSATLVGRMQEVVRSEAPSDAPRSDLGLLDGTTSSVAPDPRMRRRWTVALVAASLMLVAGVAVLVGSGSGPADPAGPPVPDGNYLPSAWPDPLVSAVVTQMVVQVEEGSTSASWLLADGGVVAARVTAFDDVEESELPSSTTPVGDEATWSSWSSSDRWTAVAVGRRDAEERLDQLMRSDAGEGLTLRQDRLPSGWKVLDDPDGVLAAAFTGFPATSSPTPLASRFGDPRQTPQEQAFVMTFRVGDGNGEADRGSSTIDLIDSVARWGKERVALTPELNGLFVDQITSSGRSLVWSPERDVVVVAAGVGLSDDELAAIARASRPVSAEAWQRSSSPIGRELPESTCRALDARPAGLGPVSDRNGVTQYGGSWIQVLSEDVFRLTPGDRLRVAEAVSADDAGFERIVERMTRSEREAFETMRLVATQPDRVEDHAADPDVAFAAYIVTSAGRSGCGFG